jgi:hypothetical protein
MAKTTLTAQNLDPNVTTGVAWTTWTPTLESGATDWNFTGKSGRYSQIGKTVFFYIVLDGVVTVGSASTGKILLPVTASNSINQIVERYTWFDTSASAIYNFLGYISSGDPNYLIAYQGDGTSLFFGSQVANGDAIYLSGKYEAA